VQLGGTLVWGNSAVRWYGATRRYVWVQLGGTFGCNSAVRLGATRRYVGMGQLGGTFGCNSAVRLGATRRYVWVQLGGTLVWARGLGQFSFWVQLGGGKQSHQHGHGGKKDGKTIVGRYSKHHGDVHATGVGGGRTSPVHCLVVGEGDHLGGTFGGNLAVRLVWETNSAVRLGATRRYVWVQLGGTFGCNSAVRLGATRRYVWVQLGGTLVWGATRRYVWVQLGGTLVWARGLGRFFYGADLLTGRSLKFPIVKNFTEVGGWWICPPPHNGPCPMVGGYMKGKQQNRSKREASSKEVLGRLRRGCPA
jgi:hypothetical protein